MGIAAKISRRKDVRKIKISRGEDVKKIKMKFSRIQFVNKQFHELIILK